MKFDATINSYVDWSQAILDHLSRTNRGWTSLLRFIEIQQNPVPYEELSIQHVGGVNSWDIACHLETFLCSWISKSLKQRRNALCGNQPGNGLEMWRQLHLEYKGGRTYFSQWPQGSPGLSEIQEHGAPVISLGFLEAVSG